MKFKGYCPECGKGSDDVEQRKYNVGMLIWRLKCIKCCVTWSINAE